MTDYFSITGVHPGQQESVGGWWKADEIAGELIVYDGAPEIIISETPYDDVVGTYAQHCDWWRYYAGETGTGIIEGLPTHLQPLLVQMPAIGDLADMQAGDYLTDIAMTGVCQLIRQDDDVSKAWMSEDGAVRTLHSPTPDGIEIWSGGTGAFGLVTEVRRYSDKALMVNDMFAEGNTTFDYESFYPSSLPWFLDIYMTNDERIEAIRTGDWCLVVYGFTPPFGWFIDELYGLNPGTIDYNWKAHTAIGEVLIDLTWARDAAVLTSRRPHCRVWPRNDHRGPSPRIFPTPTSAQTPGRITGYQ